MFYRNFNLLFQDVVIVGCGGTGSRVVGPLIQTLKQAQAQISPCLYLVDGDHFENSNLTRQNCIQKDIGRNKAVVLAERYGAALDFPVVAHPHMINAGGHMDSEIGESAYSQGKRGLLGTRKLVIMCVDSIQARLTILAQCRPDDIIIDAGNEDTFGQVSIYDRISVPHATSEEEESSVMDIKPFSNDVEIPFIAAPISQYLHARDNPSAPTGSCADLDQSLAINNLMAAGIINLVQNLAYNNRFYNRTHYYDLIKGNTSERMTNIWLNQVFNEDCAIPHATTRQYSETKSERIRHGMPAHLTGNLTDVVRMYIDENAEYIDPALLALVK